MKKLLFSLLTSISLISFAQAPEEISYQGVARNVSGSLLANQNIGIKLDLHQGSSGGAIVFSETHSKTTNAFGLFTLGIGSANTAAFTAINWANGPYFLEVSMDPAGGSSYTSVGIQQFMSVPYALYAKTAGNASPTYTAGTGINLSGNTISNSAPDQTVTITPAGSASVTGTYPNFTINTPTTQTYTAGNGIDITGGVISNTAAAVTPTITGGGATTVSGVYPNLTISTPTMQAYTAGNGIDITGGVISNTAAAVTPTITGGGATTVSGVYPNLTINTPTVAPDQVVTLLGTNAATVTGVYPNFTVDVPNGTLLPTGFFGQFLFNNGTIWDTLPRTNLFFNGTNFGIGTTSPQANFHVVGDGKFDASVSTPQIYTNTVTVSGGTLGQVLTSDGSGNGTFQNLPAAISPTINSGGVANVTNTSSNVYLVDVPAPTINYNSGTNILTLTQNGATSSTPLFGSGSTTISIVGNGMAAVTPTTGSTFTVTVPNPTLSLGSGSLSISGGNAVALPTQTLSTSVNSLTISNGNSVAWPTHSLSINSNSLTVNGPGGNTIVLPSAVTPTITGIGNAVVTPTTGNNFSVNVPTQILSVTSNSIITSNLGGSATITPAVLSYTAGTNTLKLTDGLSVNTITLNSGSQTLSVNSNSLSLSGANTVIIPTSTVVAGNTNITVSSSGNTYSVSAVTPTLNVVGGSIAGLYPNQTLTIPTSTLTGTGTGITTVSTSANNFTVNVPTQTLTVTSNSVITSNLGGSATITPAVLSYTAGTNTLKLTDGLSINTITLSPGSQTLGVTGNSLSLSGANTVIIPTSSVVAGNTNITVVNSGNTYSVSAVTPTLTVIGGSLAGSYPNQTLNIPPATITGTGTGIATVTASASNFTVNVPAPTYTATSGILSFGGTNVVVSPTLSLIGTTLTSGAPTNSVNLSSLSVWSNSVGVLYPSTLTNSVGIGTSGPLTDKMEINYASAPGATHLHFKQTGADAFARIKFSNAVSSGRYWLNSVTSSTVDANSGYNFFYFNGTTGRNLFTVGGNGKVSVNPFSLSYPTLLEVNGGFELDSTIAVNGLSAMPPVSNTSAGKIYFDKASNKFKVSENNGVYVDLLGGGAPSPWIQSPGRVTLNNLNDSVGIGTSNPTSKLHVFGISDPLQITLENGGGNFKTGLKFKTALNEWFIGQESFASSGFRITDIDAAAVRFQIDQTGNVGIGTSSPSEKLDVLGNIKLDSTLMVLGLTSMPANATFGNGRIYFDQTSGKFKVSESTGAYVDMIPVGGPPSPWIQGPGIITQNTITDKVGIGTTSPGGALDITNNAASLPGLIVNSGSATTTDGIRSGQFGSGTAGVFAISNATNSANALQAVTNGSGSAFSASNSGSGNAGYFFVSNASSNAPGIQVTTSGTGNALNANANVGTAINAVSGGAVATMLVSNSSSGDGLQIFSGTGRGINATNTSSIVAAAQFYNDGLSTSLLATKNNTTTGGNVARFENNSSSNSADAAFIYNRGSGAAIHAVSEFTNSASNTALWLENGHLKSTQSGMVSTGALNTSGGFTVPSFAPILTSCTDVKGVFSFTTSATSMVAGAFIELEIRFSKAYSASPTVVVTSSSDLQGLNYMVMNVTTSSFFVRVYRTANSNITLPTSIPNGSLFKFNYMVIE